jgi:tryptophan halogenase
MMQGQDNTVKPITSVCILGGGTAGWMTAAGLAAKLPNLSITLIESEQIGTVGVGEATLPHIRFFNQTLGIDEAEFMRATRATFKMGIEFVNWGRLGDAYLHPFGDFGEPVNGIAFHHIWNRQRLSGHEGCLFDYSYPVVSAKAGRFHHPDPDPAKIESTFGYAYQFDSGRYAQFLRRYAEKRGVTRVEGRVVSVEQDPSSGYVTRLQLADSQSVEAELFIDCSGFRGVLIEGALKAGYEDWSEWLPCNRAVAVASESLEPILPFTRATAREAGWQWRIPLQHRTGNGYVYCSDFIDDDAARDALLSALDSAAISEPKHLRFTTGRRKKFWDANVVAIGLSGGFLEPLESTSIHLIQEGITALLELFPDSSFAQSDRDEYNARMGFDFRRVRDFLLLHYVATERDDSSMWRHFQSLTLPDSLGEIIESWMHRGRLPNYQRSIFLPPSWVAVMAGQNLLPKASPPDADRLPVEALITRSNKIKASIQTAVKTAPEHMVYLEGMNAKAEPEGAMA